MEGSCDSCSRTLLYHLHKIKIHVSCVTKRGLSCNQRTTVSDHHRGLGFSFKLGSTKHLPPHDPAVQQCREVDLDQTGDRTTLCRRTSTKMRPGEEAPLAARPQSSLCGRLSWTHPTMALFLSAKITPA